MKINPVASSNPTKNKPFNINFKKGLTAKEVNLVKGMGKYEYITTTRKIQERFKINADVAKSNCVAFCVEKTAEIMSKAGFKLPSKFLFIPVNSTAQGFYDPSEDTVIINANHNAFNDLEQLNAFEEKAGEKSPGTHHFLETYLHEFSHAAHVKNIKDNVKNDITCKQIQNYLRARTPSDIMINPMKYFYSMIISGGGTEEDLAYFYEQMKILRIETGEYARDNLMEYMAEFNARRIALELKDGLNIDEISKLSDLYPTHPDSWNLKFQKWIVKTTAKLNKKPSTLLSIALLSNNECQKDFMGWHFIMTLLKDAMYTTGDIWHGDVYSLAKKSFLENPFTK